MKRSVAGVLAFALVGQVALAADGDVYRCVVAEFTSYGVNSEPDIAFEQSNKRKTFDVFEQGDRFTVVSNSAEFQSSSKDYLKVGDGVLGAYGIARSSISSETFGIGRSKEQVDSNRYDASIVGQSPGYVNTWFLTCIKLT